MKVKKSKVMTLVFIGVFWLMGNSINQLAYAQEEQAIQDPSIRATTGVLIEAASGRVLYDKEKDKKRAPASLTKMMTAILAIELGKPQEVVTISARGAGNKTGSDMGLKRDDQLALRELTKAALIVSANDSTVAIAEHVGGSEEFFLKLMNGKARSIGANNTNFQNTNGYSDPNHFSTAYDLALIARYGLANPVFATLVNTEEAEIKWLNRDKSLTLINSNRLLRQYEWINGVKTGTTNAAGKCLIASGEQDGVTLIAVVLNSSNRYGEAQKLLEYGFSLQQQVVVKGQRMDTIVINEGKSEQLGVVALEEVQLFIKPEEVDELEIKLTYDQDQLSRLPLEKNQEIGLGQIYLLGQELASFPLGTADRVEEESKKFWQ